MVLNMAFHLFESVDYIMLYESSTKVDKSLIIISLLVLTTLVQVTLLKKLEKMIDKIPPKNKISFVESLQR